MNKLFTKVVSLSLGLAMTVGIGVAFSDNSKPLFGVNAADNSTKYVLVNSTNSLEAGKSYLLTNGISGDVYTMATTSNGNNRKSTRLTVSNSYLTRGESAMSFTLEASGSYWKLKAENYANSGTPYFTQGNQTDKNYLKMAATGDDWSISFDDDAAVIKSQLKTSRNIIRYNYNQGSPLFSCYTSGQSDVYLWKEVAEKTISTISVKTIPTTTTYFAGEYFNPTGLELTATYTDGTTKTISYSEQNAAEFSFSPSLTTSLTVEHTSVTITYGGKSVTQDITVNAPRIITDVILEGDMSNKIYNNNDEWDVSGLYLTVTWDVGDPTTVLLTDLTKGTHYTTNPDCASLGYTSVIVEGTYEGFGFSKPITGITVKVAPDILNQTFTGVTGSSYSNWSNKEGTSGSGAVYAGNTSAGTDIQFRSQNPCGIWTTASGGFFDGIEVTWNSTTTDGRTIDIYGKDTPYESGDLYNNSTSVKGTKIGSISKGSSTISGDLGKYQYIGIRSNNGALYITEIQIYWAPAEPVIEFTDGGYTNDLNVVVGSTNTTTFEAENFGSLSASMFSNTSGSHSSLSYSVDGSTVTVTVSGTSAGEDSFTISATGCTNTLTLNVNVQGTTTFDSLVISTATTATSFVENEAFVVTGLVVTANYTVNGEVSSVEFSESNENLDELSYSIDGTPIALGDSLTEIGTKSIVVSYNCSLTDTIKSADPYYIDVNAYVPHTWTKVTTAPADWRGSYLLGFEDEGKIYIFNSGLETFDVINNNVVTTDFSGDVLNGTQDIDALAVKVERNTVEGTSYYHALCANGEYLRSSSKGIGHQASATTTNALTFDGTSLKIGDYWLRFNTAIDQLRFRFGNDEYLTSSTACLYKMDVTDKVIEEANTFGNDFMTNIGGACDASGTEDKITSTLWNAQNRAFNKLSVDAQGLIACAHGNETGTNYEKAIALYDYIVDKYTTTVHEDFMNRVAAGTLVLSSRTSLINITNNANQSVLFVSIILILGLTTLSGYFLIRKRKER